MRTRSDALARAGLCAKGCGRPRAYRVYCRECNAASARDWRAANRDRHNEYMRMRGASSPERHAELEMAYRAKYPEGVRQRHFEFRPHSVKQRRAYTLYKDYGLTQEQYDELLQSQGGGCAICGSTTSGDQRRPALHVDHHHETGVVRGILCMKCNVAIGSMGDDPALLDRAAKYLRGMG